MEKRGQSFTRFQNSGQMASQLFEQLKQKNIFNYLRLYGEVKDI